MGFLSEPQNDPSLWATKRKRIMLRKWMFYYKDRYDIYCDFIYVMIKLHVYLYLKNVLFQEWYNIEIFLRDQRPVSMYRAEWSVLEALFVLGMPNGGLKSHRLWYCQSINFMYFSQRELWFSLTTKNYDASAALPCKQWELRRDNSSHQFFQIFTRRPYFSNANLNLSILDLKKVS